MKHGQGVEPCFRSLYCISLFFLSGAVCEAGRELLLMAHWDNALQLHYLLSTLPRNRSVVLQPNVCTCIPAKSTTLMFCRLCRLERHPEICHQVICHL